MVAILPYSPMTPNSYGMMHSQAIMMEFLRLAAQACVRACVCLGVLSQRRSS
jgi:hypothetical protein